MDALWDSVKTAATRAGTVAGNASLKTKIKTEIMFINREITARQQAFGVQLYDYVAPLASHPDFYAANDLLTKSLQPPFITAQREIAALEIKRGKLKEQINRAAAKRAATCLPATNWQERLANVGKSTVIAGEEAKLNTEMAMLNAEVHNQKSEFGVSLYRTLENLEDTQNWLPTDREIRSIYDNCRKDIEKIRVRKDAKEKELLQLSTGSDVVEGKSSTLPMVYGAPVPSFQPPAPVHSPTPSQLPAQSAYRAATPPSQPPTHPAHVTAPSTFRPPTSAPYFSPQPPAVSAPPQQPSQGLNSTGFFTNSAQPSDYSDPYNENDFFSVVPMQSALQPSLSYGNDPLGYGPSAPPVTVYDPFGSTASAPSKVHDPFSAPPPSRSSNRYDPFSGL